MGLKNKKETNKTLLTDLITVQQSRLDKEVITMILKNLVNWVERNDLYNNSAWVIEEYNQLKHSLDSLYSFIYTPKQSNLSLKDAKVFASYLFQQANKLKDIIDIIDDNKKWKHNQ